MKLNELSLPEGETKDRKRKGRGCGSGRGKTAGHGIKGQLSRSGGAVPVGFEGGQMPLQRRLPKRGFKNMFAKEYSLLKISDLEVHFDAGAQVTVDVLREKGLVRKGMEAVKLLADGELTKAMTVTVSRASREAVAKVEGAGGTVAETVPPKAKRNRKLNLGKKKKKS